MNEDLNISPANNKIPFLCFKYPSLSVDAKVKKTIPIIASNIIYINNDYFSIENNYFSVFKTGLYSFSFFIYSTSVASYMQLNIYNNNGTGVTNFMNNFPNTYHTFGLTQTLKLSKDTKYYLEIYNETGTKTYAIQINLTFLTN